MKKFWTTISFSSGGCNFFKLSRVALLTGAKPSEAKTFAALPYWPWKHKFFARLIISSEFVSFDRFDCFKEQASFHSPPKSPLFQRLILSRILWSLFRLCFCPPLLLARKMHLDNPKSFLQFSSVLGSSMQSVMTSEKSSDHLYRTLIGT